MSRAALTRREFGLMGAAAAGWLFTPARFAALAQAPSDMVARVSRVIEAYDAQGIHRTGTDTDDASGAWLLAQAKQALRLSSGQAGAEAALERFSLSRLDVRKSVIEVRGKTVEGLPLFDGGFTGADGISGRLGAGGTEAEIGLVDADSSAISSEGRSLAELRRAGRHRAIVVVTRGAQPGLIPMNAGQFTQPYGVPVVQVGSNDATFLHEAAKNHETVRVTAHAVRVDDTAANVVATVRGTSANLPGVVVITPRSGWWHCASERGGGIACWLEIMRAAAERRRPRTIQFVASSGHELGHLGLDHFIHARQDLVKAAAGWLHLGANIGAAGGRMRLQASDDQMEERAATALTRAGAAIDTRVPRGTVPAGEARNIHVGGGRYASLVSSGPYFHSITDRWPVAVDARAVSRYATAVADLVLTLAS
jgi:hypothetical protein